MPAAQHRLEVRGALLADRIKRRVGVIRDAVAPAGERLPFSVQLGQRDALAWWQANRYGPLGQRVIDAWPQDQRDRNVLELDAALADQNARQRAAVNPATRGGA